MKLMFKMSSSLLNLSAVFLTSCNVIKNLTFRLIHRIFLEAALLERSHDGIQFKPLKAKINLNCIGRVRLYRTVNTLSVLESSHLTLF
jgi:hypothetical protein